VIDVVVLLLSLFGRRTDRAGPESHEDTAVEALPNRVGPESLEATRERFVFELSAMCSYRAFKPWEYWNEVRSLFGPNPAGR
jgi:hypothetical protein